MSADLIMVIWVLPLVLAVVGWAFYGRTHRNPTVRLMFHLGLVLAGVWIVGSPMLLLICTT